MATCPMCKGTGKTQQRNHRILIKLTRKGREIAMRGRASQLEELLNKTFELYNAKIKLEPKQKADFAFTHEEAEEMLTALKQKLKGRGEKV